MPNILKLIEPLFLNKLYRELNKISDSNLGLTKKINALVSLQQKVSDIKVFDPACGSGNFLIIAYKKLRDLEIEILRRQQELELERSGQIVSTPFSLIKLTQFYGIELDDFAHEIAGLSLWLAEHQMNTIFEEIFGENTALLPLKSSGHIVHANSLQLDWSSVCNNVDNNVFVIGNPPFQGESRQSREQKSDLDTVFNGLSNYKKQDYISCFFLKAARYMNSSTEVAFVSTSSICQGMQVGMLWPHIFSLGVEIFFCHKAFQWTNNARKQAGVYCVIIGLRYQKAGLKKIYDSGFESKVETISPYLTDGPEICVTRRSSVLFGLPKAMKGNGVYDGGNLLLNVHEKNEILTSDPATAKFIRPVTGTDEFIKGKNRCVYG